jgi:tRNA splicing endonuclease
MQHRGVLQGHTVRVTDAHSINLLYQQGIGRLITIIKCDDHKEDEKSTQQNQASTITPEQNHSDQPTTELQIQPKQHKLILSLIEAFALQSKFQLIVTIDSYNSSIQALSLNQSHQYYSQLQSRFAILYAAYSHLTESSKYVVKCASKYGADFALYNATKTKTTKQQKHEMNEIQSISNNSESTTTMTTIMKNQFKHSSHLVVVRSKNDSISRLELLTYMRVARSVKKQLLICRVDDELQNVTNINHTLSTYNDEDFKSLLNQTYACSLTKVQLS